MKIGLVACGKAKLVRAAPAKDLYVGPLFKLARAYAEQMCDTWFILSAKHGLVEPGTELEPYDHTLPNAGPRLAEWRRKVAQALMARVSTGDVVLCLASQRYFPGSFRSDISVLRPLAGRNMFEQLRWLRERIVK